MHARFSNLALSILSIHHTGPQILEVSTSLEQFERDGVTVILEWTLEYSGTFYSYHVTVVPSVAILTYSGRVRVQLKVSYDVSYNISVVASSLCGQRNVTAFTILHYGEY